MENNRDPGPPEGHRVDRLGICDEELNEHTEKGVCVNWRPYQDPVRFLCTCGARWTVSAKEFSQGTDHITDHYVYAKRTATRVD